MAKLWSTLIDENGTEVHRNGNRKVCGHFFYGSAKQSILGVRVCMVVVDDGVETTASIYNPDKTVLCEKVHTFPMPKSIPMVI